MIILKMQRAFVLGIATCCFQLLLYCTSFVMEQRVIFSPSLRRETFSKFPSVYADLVDVGFEEKQLHPDVDESFVRARFFMPSVVEKVLIDQEVESINALDLLSRVDLSNKHRELALEALISTIPQCINVPMLNENECKKLKAFVNSRIIDDGIDDTDGCPDYQVNISEQKLERLLSPETMQRIKRLPLKLESNAPSKFERIGVFIRMYKPDTRPWMPFHIDNNKYTVNIALNDDREYEGGNLVALFGNRVQKLERTRGMATCHKGSCVHGVTTMSSGTRYSLILFFHSINES